MSSSAEFLSNLKEAGQSIISTRRPWRLFLDPSALSLPSSLSEATTRLVQNLTHFLFNYTLLVLLVLFLGLIYHPLAMIVFLVVFAGWYFLYLARDDESLTFFNLVTVDDRVLVVVLGVVTVVALVMTGVWLNVIVSLVVGVVVVCLHAALRGTDELVVDDHDYQSPYDPMLSDTAAGAYTRV
ncbi:PRA1 family protein D-like [Gastrolobium bilobum]|uniref:PRA1 family protein D-like n=1 Tax=Gastrolobium bilobum TaxID=150636 RepID=UPI002AAFABE3|nr:PRA1 family protein D-like [Gastrolobium bilobum]